MKDNFIAARAVRNEMHTIDQVDLYNIDCFVVNNHTAAQMMEWVNKAEATNALLVILFHGVGGGNSLNVSVNEHNKFMHQLKQKEKDVWITTMLDASEFIKKYQAIH
jgi:sialate O-acetylesterase